MQDGRVSDGGRGGFGSETVSAQEAGRFAGAEGRACHTVAGVGDEITADAATAHEKIVDICADKAAQRYLITARAGMGLFKGAFSWLQTMDVRAAKHLADAVRELSPGIHIFSGQSVQTPDTPPLPNANGIGGGCDVNIFPYAAQGSQTVHYAMQLLPSSLGGFRNLLRP